MFWCSWGDTQDWGKEHCRELFLPAAPLAFATVMLMTMTSSGLLASTQDRPAPVTYCDSLEG